LGLARILLGASGGGAFLLVLPHEMRPQADQFLEAANARIAAMSRDLVRLVWAVTENLGDWSDVRKRLNEDMGRRTHTLALASDPGTFVPASGQETTEDTYFTGYLSGVRDAAHAGWSPEDPARILLNEGKHQWPLGASADAIPMARHVALSEDGAAPATLETLAARASGQPAWGVLRAAVDNFDVRMRRASSDAEFIQLSLVFRQFFAGELEMACSMPEFWRKVTILYSGIDDFAAYGSWDALVLLAREMQRVFHRFADANLKELPGPEGKTVTMALVIAPRIDEPFARVWEETTRRLPSCATRCCAWCGTSAARLSFWTSSPGSTATSLTPPPARHAAWTGHGAFTGASTACFRGPRATGNFSAFAPRLSPI
jgi:CRISPR-associated protein Csm1